MEEEKITELVCLIDRSLSMHGQEKQVRETVNSLIRHYRSREEKCFISICLFSEKLDVLYMHQEDRFAKELTAGDYFVSGSTALFDAFQETVLYLENTLDYLRKPLIKEVHFYLLTDGTDNASLRNSAEECDALLAQKQKQRWQFRQLNPDCDLTKRNLQWKSDVSFVWKKR